MFNDHISIKEAKNEQDEMKEEIAKLENYNPTNEKKIKSKEEALPDTTECFDIRSKIIKASEDGIFPLPKENLHKEQAEKEKK